MILIAIDDGHGRETVGKRTPPFADGYVMRENEFNDAVAGYLDKALKSQGFATLRVNPETTDTPLETRVRRANEAKADCYISIHANAFASTWNEACGIETWVFEGAKSGGDTYRLAEALQTQLIQKTGRKNRRVKTSGALYVLNSTKMPAALVECGFMTNPKEAALLRDESYRKLCAEALCTGICSYFGIQYMEGNPIENLPEEPALQEPVLNPNPKCPQWKIDGEAYLREAGYTSSPHNPLELIDYGSLGVILKRTSLN